MIQNTVIWFTFHVICDYAHILNMILLSIRTIVRAAVSTKLKKIVLLKKKLV